MTRLQGWAALLLAVGMVPVESAQASEKIQLSLGGYSKWWLVGAWSEQSYQSAASTTPSNLDVKGDNEIHFLGRTTLDNGLTVGIKTELEAGGHTDQRTDTIDKAFVWVQGGFGKLELGTDYNAASLLHVCAPDAAGLWNGPSNGVMSDLVISRPAAVSTMTSGNETGLDHDDNADKVMYFTPAFHGVTLGLSYTPSAMAEDNRTATQSTQVYALGLGYEQNFGGVDIGLSAGLMSGDLESGTADTAQASFRAYSLGAQATYGGVTVGASMARHRNDYQSGTFAAGAVDDSGLSWDVGIQYADGPYTVSLAHYQSQVRGLVSDDGRDRVTVYQASGKYMLGPGVAIMGSVGHISYDDEAAGSNPANHNKGLAVMTGLGLWF